jgi:1,4-dihydroxy-2-naphthoyl-CoA hydrolase
MTDLDLDLDPDLDPDSTMPRSSANQTDRPLFAKSTSVEELNRLHEATLVGHLGIEMLEIGEDFLRARMPVDARTVQPYGLLHGGASVVLSETLGTAAAILTLQEGEQAVGLEINANHLRGVRAGWVSGLCRPVHVGRSTQVWQTEVFDEQDRLCCTSRLTVSILRR